ncbi:MAG: pyruvate carboxylase subunit B [Chitinivibrionales bacterium]|nr:pyruvate carboxylase subunit B [Chitinivibrionales bacterium]
MAHQTSKKEKQEEKLHKIPLRITDTTLRDAHQSLWATRMRTDDILKIIDTIDKVGYYTLEVWGGATFDTCLRFLRENPWERLRQIKSRAKNTPLQMLLRGQNLVGYRNYADDVVDKFVELACENGMDVFRVFDALNDTRNLEAAVKAVKRNGGHAQGTLCYTISPVHTVELYVKYAKEQVAIGIDSIAIKDMAGILSPIAAERLITTLIREVNIPVQVHGHASSGMATATYVEAVRAGAGAIDCAVSTMAGFSSQPPVETLVAIFSETNYAADLDLDALNKVAKYFAELAPTRKTTAAPGGVIDPSILRHQIPGGMISNFRSQLEKQGMLDKLDEACEEVPRVRKDLGFPPLVTPTSQIVGTQAAMNIIAGERYKIVPNEVKNYLRGMYGKTPVPVDPEFMRSILGDEKPIDTRPADLIEPMLPKATEGLDSKYIEHEEDIISYIILPEPSLEFFTWRALPQVERPEIPADIELKKIKDEDKKSEPVGPGAPGPVAAPGLSPTAGPPQKLLQPQDYQGLGHLVSSARGLNFNEIKFRKGDFELSIQGAAEPASASSLSFTTGAPASAQQPGTSEDAASAKEEVFEVGSSAGQPAALQAGGAEQYEKTIDAPLVGTFYMADSPGKPPLVKVGDSVKKGSKVCVVEAMKLFNPIEAPCDCTIAAFLAASGDNVEKGQPLVAIKQT